MKDPDTWRWTKYVETPKGLKASRVEVSPGSLLLGDRVAGFYGRVIPEYATGVLLDLGCGEAPLYGLYSRYTTDAICVDWSNSVHPNPHLDFVQDLNEPLTSLEEKSVHTVILSDVLEHIRHPDRLLGEIARVLGPRGHLLMNVPFMYGLHETPYDFYRYTRYGLEQLLGEAGFDVIELEPMGGAPEVLVDLVSKSLTQVPRVGRFAARGVQAGWTAAINRGIGVKLSTRSSAVFPLGYGLVAVNGR